MAATPLLKIYTGSNAQTMSPADDGDASNWNLMSVDEYDSTGTNFQSNPISVKASGDAFSYERWMKVMFSGSFNLIDNVLAWQSAGSPMSDLNLVMNVGRCGSTGTPIDTESSVAVSGIPVTSGTAIDLTPVTGSITDSNDTTDFLIAQLKVPDTVTTPGDVGAQTLTFQYDES